VHEKIAACDPIAGDPSYLVVKACSDAKGTAITNQTPTMMHKDLFVRMAISGGLLLGSGTFSPAWASSHREAPLIANDPLADNTDLYAFRSPDDPNTITIIANYIPAQLAFGGPNYASFGEGIRYEIHIDNDVTTAGDDVTYRFTFHKTDQDPTTFFNIRLGQQNLLTVYTMEKSIDGGATWTTVITNGAVPPPNIGPRSIGSAAGLGTTYDALVSAAILTASSGETVYCGPADDPFFSATKASTPRCATAISAIARPTK
jgi:hypothetical protein